MGSPFFLFLFVDDVVAGAQLGDDGSSSRAVMHLLHSGEGSWVLESFKQVLDGAWAHSLVIYFLS